MARILVAFSGGADSAVAAHRLRAGGWDVTTVTLELLPADATVPRAVAAERIAAARRLARSMGLAHEVWDLSAQFEQAVVGPFVESYAWGQTPNPCVWCNARIKLGAFLARAQARGWQRCATGHYVRKVPLPPGAAAPQGIACAADREKDQSYMLWAIDAHWLPRLEFPLGACSKAEVLQIAREIGIAEELAPESQDLCFVGAGGYAGFLALRLAPEHPGWRPGPVIDPQGRELGRHRGCLHYTVGQRRGLGVASPAGTPLYVTAVAPEERRVTVGPAAALERRRVTAVDCHSFVPQRLQPGRRLLGRIRYRQACRPGTVVSASAGRIDFCFDECVRGVAPGQSLVLYEEDLVIAGGRFI